jgi:hypothetical protein
MNAAELLHELGQSLWLDNITRGLLASGTLQRYLNDYAVTGLTSNPTIFDHAIRNTDFYDKAISEKTAKGKSGEALFFELALEDLTQAADLFRPIHAATAGIDGWVSLEVSPLLANDTPGTVRMAAQLHDQAERSNLSSSRFRGHLPALPPLRNRYSLACRSTSRYCSRASNTSQRRTPTCAALSGVSPPGSIQKWGRSLQFLSAAGMWP